MKGAASPGRNKRGLQLPFKDNCKKHPNAEYMSGLERDHLRKKSDVK